MDAWTRQLERLQAAGAVPAAEERVSGGGMAAVTVEEVWQRGPQAAAAAARSQGGVDFHAVASTLKALQEPEVRRRRTKAVWAQALKKCFPTASSRPAREWNHGGRDRAHEAKGARMHFVLSAGKECKAQGGEARWMQRSDVNSDGFVDGWQQEAQRLTESVTFNDDKVEAFSPNHKVPSPTLPTVKP